MILGLSLPIAERFDVYVRESGSRSRGSRDTRGARWSRRAFGGIAFGFAPLLA